MLAIQPRRGENQANARTPAPLALDAALAADGRRALAQVFQAVTPHRPRPSVVNNRAFPLQSPPVVLNLQGRRARIQPQLQDDLGGGGVFDDVVQDFFDGQKQVMPHFRCQ